MSRFQPGRQGLRGVIACLLLAALLATGGTSASDAAVHAADTVAGKWLALLDGRQYRDAWREAATLFRAQLGVDDWERAVTAARRPLGDMRRRELISATRASRLPGAPEGDYVVLRYRTDFEHSAGAIETITPMRDGDAWRVSGYYVRPGS